MAEKTIIIDATDSAGSQVENLSQLLTSGWQIRTAYSVGREGTALMVILKKTTQETDQKAARLIKNVAGDELSGVASLNSYLHGEGVAGQQKIIRRFPVGDQALLIIIGAPPAGDPTPVAQEAFLVGTLGDPAAAVATINARMSEPDNPWQHKRSNPWQILTAYVVGKKGTSLLVIMEKRSGPHVQVKLVKNTGSDQDSGRAALAAYQADERAGGFVIARRYSIGDQAALYLLGDPPADGDASDEECCGEIFTGSGAPSDSIGADGNTYFDTTTGDMYRKRDGRWGSAVATLKGSAGNKILSGSGDPSGVSGLTASAGDLYIDTANSRLYQRGASSWGQIAVLSGSPGAQGVTGPQGLAGPQGAKGDTGVQGTQGAQGSTGAQGVAGNTGVQGTQGTTGVQGAQGIKGDTGIQGVQGAQGNTGIQGTQGHTGIQGLQGVQGTTGIQGVQGTQGNTGIQGIQGTQGHTGIQGIQGTQGLTGTQGIQGTQGNTGIQGIKGDTGIQGLQGVKGDTGIQGIQGTQGLTGIAGKEVLSDTGAPAGALGKIGDLYIDTQTYQLLRKTATSTWTAAGYVKGSTGLQGVQGNTGIQGIQGTQGNTGIQGVQGTQGNTGIQGIQGLQGNTGIQGIQGTQGLTGIQGVAGLDGKEVLSDTGAPAGALGKIGDLYIDTQSYQLLRKTAGATWTPAGYVKGSTGIQGVQGNTGIQGIQGTQGNTGIQGVQGTQGNTGIQGVAGIDGKEVLSDTGAPGGALGKIGDLYIDTQTYQLLRKTAGTTWTPAGYVKGSTGIQGVQGNTGIQGIQGTQGNTGIQGIQGTQGNTGIQGVAGIDGKEVLSDTGAPAGTLGKIGDLYIDTQTYQLLRKTAGTTWTAAGYVKGSTGIQGVQGNTGIQGIQGTQGNTGIQGVQGIKGDTGIQGVQGTQGNTGIQGVAGLDGKEVLSDTGAPAGALGKIGDLYIDTLTYQMSRKTGAATWTPGGYVKGSTGIQGIQGTQGNTGIQGIQGTQGNTGIQGVQGVQGNTGIQGIQGTQGNTGIQGTQGLTGIAGKEVLSDTGAPAGALGKIGDLYIDTLTYQLSRKTGATTWTAAGYVKGSTGIQGVQGNTGIQGIQGTQGNTGIQGIQGTQGNTGIQGIQGTQGNTGIQGVQGIKGDTGIQGIQGTQGSTGIQGVAGIDGKEVLSDTGAPAGALGKIGDLYIDTLTYQMSRKTGAATWTPGGYVKGSTGIQGIQGTQGNTGIQGIQGTQGNTGIQGVQGIKGDTGIQGVQGTQGNTGIQGVQGVQGNTGIQGVQGTQGNTGIQGVAGIDGKEVLSDTGAPAGALGKIGDLYIDTLTYQMSRKTGAATWTPGGYVKGSTGIQGIQGTQGNTGIQGIQGTQGNTGIQGIQGAQGNTGIQGVQGIKGDTGIQGLQGVQGNTGIQGIQGTQGNTGIQGTQGSTGIPGKEVLSDTGAPAGALGKIGDLYIDTLTYQLSRKTGATTWTAAGYVKGSTGIQGVQGNTGIQGIQGTQGNTGIQGIQGTQGNTGIQGIQGTQGNTGIQGVAGVDGKEVLSDTGAPAGALGKIGDLYIDTLTYQMSRKTGAATWTPGGYVKGSTGIQGIQGTQGNTGIQGIQGTQGNTGIQGIQGTQGNTGIQGVQGIKGDTGIQGLQGVQGNTGIQGIQGTQGNTGIQGTQGSTGIPGKEVLSDTGAPAGALGKIGDLYIDTLTYQLSRKTGATTWTAAGYVKGSTGIQGVQGNTGIQGIQGTQGNTGIQGIQGTQGNTGIQGIQGTQGNTGIQGIQGIKGDTGIQGVQGTQGNTGIQGIQGTQGNTGIQGVAGIDGKEVLSDTGAPAGALGKIGDLYIDTLTYQMSRKTGAATWTPGGYVKGSTGIQGIQGTQGNTGIQGVQGTQGNTGIQGVQGIKGDTGIQGIQGTQGNTGIQGVAGVDGKEVLSDTGAPAGALGKIGDLYIDTLTYQMSRKTGAATWTPGGYVKGSTGIQGIQGTQGNTGIQGIQGTQGNTGIQGIQGTQGNTGIQGVQGIKGDTGIQGLQGVQGNTGIQGIQGTQGNTGIQGTQGSTGIPGKEVLSDTGAPAGALGKIGDLYIDTLTYQLLRKTGSTTWTAAGYVKGSTGLQGVQGNTGIQGIQGTQGNTGIQGIQGTQGNTGIQGVQGIKGDTGIQGVQGTQGNTGIQGIQGVQGNTGIQGIQGTQGNTGIQGVAGIDGKEVLSDTGAPAGALGKIGDLYIDTLTYQMSRKTGAATWTPGGYVKGSTGIQGIQGTQGNTGIQGIQGTQGNTGIQGIQGVQGNTGIQGVQGIKGDTGIQGVQGTQGNTGIQGIQGTQGNTGIQGVQGIKGDTGIQGIQGTQGNTGIQGIQGAQGNTGIQGVAGIDGKEVLSDTGTPRPDIGKIGDLYIDTLTYLMSRKVGPVTWTPTGNIKGPAGAQGATGIQGNQGNAGSQGATGLQGGQGIQGNTGVQGIQGATGVQGVQGIPGTQGVTGPAGGGGSGSSPQFILYQERQSSGSNAGIWGADTGTWITRFLNYRAADDTSSVTFVNTPDRNGRGLSIPAGTYIIKRAFAAAFGVGSHIARIRVVSTGETFYGTEGIDNGGQGNSYSEIVGAKFMINSTSTIFLEQICASPTGTNNARGTAVGVPDDTIVNIFSSIELQKVA